MATQRAREALQLVCATGFFNEESAYHVDCCSYSVVGAGHVLFTRPVTASSTAVTAVTTAVTAVASRVTSSPMSAAEWLRPRVAYPFQQGL